MGCNASVSNCSIEEITDEQIQQIKDGTISPLSFQIFLNNFYFVTRYKNFYTELPLEKQILVIESIGILTKNECSTIIENYCKYAEEKDEDLYKSLQSISKKMISKTHDNKSNNDVYLPVALDSKLWKSVMVKKFKTRSSEFRIFDWMMDFSNQEIIDERELFISEKQNEIIQFDHSKDISLLIQNNPIDNLWKKNIKMENNFVKKNIPKPFFWEKNIHHAAYKGKKTSVEYSLSLIPQMLFLLDYKNNNVVHYAAQGNQNDMLIYLHDIGADFNLSNSEGLLPIHLISNKSVIGTMSNLGIDINVRNEEGESLLDIRTRIFDKAMIKTLLGMGYNIFEPNPNGDFWIQTAIHNEYYGKMKQEKFVNFVRMQLFNNKTASWNENPIYQEIINRKEKNQEYVDINDLNESVREQNIPRINVLLAMGTKADQMDSNRETNLFYCSKKGLIEIATILLNNYCDPNFTNSREENTFWVATLNEHFDLALLLCKKGADTDHLDSSGETLLHNVYRRKITHIFQFVLDAGGSPNIKNRNEETVTFIAFKLRDDEVGEMLQNKYKGDINSQDRNKNSLVHLAIDENDFDRIDYLCKRKINMNLIDQNGHTVLMKAFLKGVNINKLDFLVNHGSDINCTDKKCNSLLHHLLFRKNPSMDVFLFLIDKKIDINIKNNNKQYPISIAIKNSHDDIGFKLLDLNCQLLDPNSIHEPIVEALARGSSKWFEALVYHGADAMNQKVGVIARYIDSGFYNYRVFKKIPRMEIFLEAPLQKAIYKKLEKCALDIWNQASTEKLKKQLASNKDENRRIPLSAAIMVENEKFVNILLNEKYDCNSKDVNGRTPFIYACISDHIPWMVDLFKIYTTHDASIVDNYGCSALTYAASNKRKDFCDILFINNIEINNIKVDEYGIIKNYRNLMERYNDAKNRVQKYYNESSRALGSLESDYKSMKSEYDEIDYKISQCEKDVNYYGNKPEGELQREYEDSVKSLNSLRKRKKYLEKILPICHRELNKTKNAYNLYKSRYETIKKATRKDILGNISYYENISKYDVEIGDPNYKDRYTESDCTIC